MDPVTPAADDPLKLFKKAFHDDDAESFRGLLRRFPEMKSRINDPVASFDSPVIIQVRSRAMLDVLLEAGADINAKSRWWAGGFGLLHGAPPDLAAYAISRGAVVDVHAAARLGLYDRLQELVTADPQQVHARGGDGQTPLHFASTMEIAGYLLDHGADIDAKDVDHESTPAQYRVRDRPEVARFLIQRGCQTDLLLAAALGESKLVARHLDADPACIRMKVSEKWFPKRDPRSGGTIYIWTLGQNKSAHAVAREFGHAEVLRLLWERSPEELRLVLALELGDEDSFKSLTTGRPDLLAKLTPEDHRKLTDAAQDNNTRAVERMLEAGWPVDVPGQHGGTALHWAGFHGNAEMADIILRHHSALEAVDSDYKSTPVGWAIHGCEHGWHRATGNYAGTVEALLKTGAKLPAQIAGTQAVQEVLRRFS